MVSIRSAIRQRRDHRNVVPGAGAEAAIGSGACWDQGKARAVGSGDVPHQLHNVQGDVGADVRNPPAIESELWAAATVERVAKRVHWVPPDDVVQLVPRRVGAGQAEADRAVEAVSADQVEQANLFVLFQPIYQIGVRRSIKTFPLTAAGWQVEMYGAQPA